MIWETRERKKEGGGGGGGKPRIRFGRTGPRGRVYAKPAKGTVAIVKSKYIKAGKGSRAAIREHLRYIQERERGENEPERKFFDRGRDGIERPEVYDKMMASRGDKTAMHTLILSPGDNSVDIKDYTRETMKALEERLGHDVDWYATIHQNTEHHHAHVVIGGRIPGRERETAREYSGAGGREINKSGRWTGEEKELRELLGKGYDERPATDPREDRAAERSRWGNPDEREETDPRVKDLIDESARSPEEMRTERMLNRYESQMAIKDWASKRGDVYLDINDLRELRSAGNDYIQRERSLERELDSSIDREMSRDIDFGFERERPVERDRDDDFGRSRGERGSREDREERDDFER